MSAALAFARKLIEYLRFWPWIPTQRIRCVTVCSIETARGRIVVQERQRLHFGRFGRWRWKRERRFAITPETVH